MMLSVFRGWMGFLSILGLVCALSWFLLLNKPARRKLVDNHWSLFGWSPFNVSEKQRELDEILTFACLLISAITTTTILVFILISILVRILKQE